MSISTDAVSARALAPDSSEFSDLMNSVNSGNPAAEPTGAQCNGSRVACGIVIVSFNTRDLTLACLRSVEHHAAGARVMVVDNASDDGSADAIASEFPDVGLLRLPHNIGFGRANTLAMTYLNDDIIVLLNSDAVLTNNSLHHCVERLAENEKLGAVTPRLVGTDGQEQRTRHAVPTFQKTFQRAMWRRPMESTETEFWIPGTCMVLKRSAVKAAGGLFDPALFIYWEDADLCSRLKNAGYELDVVEGAQVIHHGGASGGGPNCSAKSGLHEWYTYGRHFWFRRHRPRREAICLWLLEFVDAFRCMARSTVRSERRHESGYGKILLKTLFRQLTGHAPTFAVPDLHGRRDGDLVDTLNTTSTTRRPVTKNPQTTPTCGVVIIGRNEGERLQRSIHSVKATELPFVYVDSGSTDGSQQLATDNGAMLIELDLSTPFTAARARMAGFHHLLEQHPHLDTVQFLDGDCELSEGWLTAAHAALQQDSECAIVCGVLREREPERSVYNRLCQLEWRRPVGKIASCGGIFLARTEALLQSGGFDTSLIAGEEPELCVRLRAQQWNIQAIADVMASHDANMTEFGQWWKRSVRAGFGYAQGYAMHGHRPERFRRREVRSILFYGLVAPVFASVLAWPTAGLSLLILGLGYVRLYRRVRAGRIAQGDFPTDAAIYARFVFLGKFAQTIGVLRFHVNRIRRRAHQLIEYK